MSGGELTAQQIRALLKELARRLKDRGVHGDIKLVRGRRPHPARNRQPPNR
ncbi:hypothetical protein [Arthrobacter sp. AZCC_0090]|uniref:hypothetical protein n=1 Tax=Arthrobacter sp. AZCC_0090 TaxID=2735881 RepID=UPI0016201298|nr:hypothetical protein [Arthrobacter sp. AZCC_0090]MBB6402709.1 hypothetical protein [Arthrobacter sp. AZCC_0090]